MYDDVNRDGSPRNLKMGAIYQDNIGLMKLDVMAGCDFAYSEIGI
jgi:hypothetical protein